MSPEPSIHPSHEELYAYRDGELTADRRVTVEAHVLNCRVCRESMDEISEIEAALRSRPDDMDEEYFEGVSERALARVAGVASPRPIERRKPVEAPDREEKRARAPGLPWAAIASAVSAAAAVIVVIVVLARQGAIWQKAPEIAVLERSAPDAARTRAAVDTTVPPQPVPGPPGARMEDAKKSSKDVAARAPVVAEGQANAPREEMNRRDQDLALLKSETEQRGIAGSTAPNDKMATREVAGAGEALQSSPKPTAAAPSLGAIGGAAPSSNYDAFIRRYGLPPLWGPGVSDDLVLRAENGLRNFYRTGGAKTAIDSARARLYLAEAARLHAGASPDTAAIEDIARHYRRAITLAKDDPQTAGIARSRLEDFLREVGVWR